MKLDSTTTTVIIDAANKHAVPSSEVHKMLEAYYKGVRHIIENEKPAIIKIDFFGKLVFSDAYKRKLEDILNKIQ